MGVDTKAIIRKGTTIEQIADAIAEKYEGVRVIANQPDFMQIIFLDGKDGRTMWVSFTGSCLIENGIDGVWCSLGSWGNSIPILKYLCEVFGGYLDENDCDDEGFYPINHELYMEGEDFSALDLFRHKVITKLGYDKLKDAMELLNEFKSVSS